MKKNIRILGHTYKIMPQDNLFQDTGTPALINKRTQIISYDPTLNKSSTEESILHEVIEALNFHLGMNLEHDKQLIPLSEGIYATLKGAKWLTIIGEEE